MQKSVYFISDLHLGLENPEKEKKKEKLLIDFLYEESNKMDKLIILGDLFDYWFEYRRVMQRGYYKTLSALSYLAEKGVEIHYLIGNHDFLHRDFFEKEFNAKLYQKDLELIIDGKKFYLSHGDGLVHKDYGYRILKKILRNKFLQWMYSLLHPDFGIWLASSTSKTSRNYTEDKNYGEIDGLFEFAKNKIDNGFDYVIMGHTHKLVEANYNNGFYINLGTWLRKPCYGVFENSKFEIKVLEIE